MKLALWGRFSTCGRFLIGLPTSLPKPPRRVQNPPQVTNLPHKTCILLLLLAAPALAAPRQHLIFNRDWKFLIGDHPGAEARAYDDASWEPVMLPHSFNLPYFRSADFYVGYGWYRKHFQAPAGWQQRRTFLEFDGVFQDAEVFVNGRAIGRHQGGYTGFTFDITPALAAGDNVIAVRVDNNWNARLAPRAGEHEFIGGIYRDAYLTVVDPLHVAWNGTFVTTPEISAESARVNVKTEVRNDSASARQATVVTTVVDPDGRTVLEMRTVQAVPPQSDYTFDQTSEPLAHPKLWHPDHPFLYSVHTTVGDDTFDTPFGFRWFRWSATEGFFLNGEHLYLRGANVHQDHAGWGIAVTRAGAWRDVQLIKDAGFNFIRGSHYPHHPAFVEACDRLGILFWSENVFWGRGGFGKDGFWSASAYPIHAEDFAPFEESCQRQLAEMIRIHRNHPSIAIWSMSNEPFFTENQDRARALVTALVKLSHQLDPTRAAAVGGAQRGGFDRLGDVAGYNGDGARLFLNPGFPSLVSEYGTVAKGIPGDYDPYFGDLADQPQYPWRAGQAIWAGFDYGTIAGRQGFKGIVDYFRLPKRAWYWYRNAYLHIAPPEWPKPGTPARLQLTADRTTIHGADGTDDCQIVVAVLDRQGRRISNSPPVTLEIASGPGEFPTGPSIAFTADSEIMIVDGQAAMEFRSYYGGQTVIRATSPGLPDATLAISTVGTPPWDPPRTPTVRPRPYVPSGLSKFRSTVEGAASDVARDRPSTASTESPEHAARFANDGAPSTTWAAAPSDEHPWWQADLEGFYLIASTRIDFGAAGTHAYKVEVSRDRISWTTAIDQSRPKGTEPVRTDNFSAGIVARYVRITLLGDRGLADVAILGVPWTR
jgi:hypothetical protein